MALEVAQPLLEFSELKNKGVEVSRIYDDDFVLLINEDPGPWIERNLPRSLSIRSLELYKYDDGERIGDSIAQLAQLTHLSIDSCNSLKCVSNVMMLHNLQVLIINDCNSLKELPANLGDLRNLTHLHLFYCFDIKCLPNSIAQLSKLSTLILGCCAIELPENLGDLRNLTYLKLSFCQAIKCLPNSIAQLSKLSNLILEGFPCLIELPANLGDLSNLTHLEVSYCKAIKFLPNSLAHLSKLSTLIVDGCASLVELPANLNVINLILKDCPSLSEQCLSNFTGLRNLQRLQLNLFIEKFAINLDELPQLVLLDVSRCNKIKYLPSNIKDLHKLRFLYLPRCFILETLPSHLNDSVIISVEGSHIRKTWKELKLEMGPRFIEASPPLVDMLMETAQNCSSPSCWGYLSLKENPSTWIINHCHDNLCSWIRLLDLQVHDNVEKIADVIRALPSLTHLYYWAKSYRQSLCLPDTTNILTHLCLYGCDLDYLSDNLDNLSNLKSLDLSLVTYEQMESSYVSYFQTIPESLESLVSLEHLTLRRLDSSLPNSLAKLCNLNTLELHSCYKVSSFPENIILTKLKLVDCSVESLPLRLCHLEIVHHWVHCCDYCVGDFEMFSKLPINLKILSLTCHRFVLFKERIPALQLQIILFKECIELRELMPNMDELVELCTLNISDTMITSLPECITRLPKLQHLVLPKCFKPTDLPHEFLRNGSNLKIEYDGMYKDYETSDGDNEITPGYVVGVDDGIRREVVKEGIVSVQSSSCRLPIPPEGLEGNHMSGQNSLACENSHYAKNSKGIIPLLSPIENTSYSGEEGHAITMDLGNEEPNIAPSSGVRYFDHVGNNHHAVVDAQTSNNPLGDDIKGGGHNMTIIETAKTFGDFHVRGQECLEMESLSTGFQAMVAGGDSIGVRPFAHDAHNHHGVMNSHDNSFRSGAHEKSNKQKIEITCEQIQNLRDENMSLVEAAKKLGVGVDDGIQGEVVKEGTINEQSSSCLLPIPPEALEVDPQSSKNPPGAHQKGNRQKIEITHEQIQSLRDDNMSLVEAGKKLGVSRSTVKRRCKELGLGEWPSSKKKKNNSSKNNNTKSHSGGELLRPNLVGCTNSVVPEYADESLDANQHNLFDQQAPKFNPIRKSTSKATTECVREVNEATQSHMDFQESIPECTVGTDVQSLLGTKAAQMSMGDFPWPIDVPGFILHYIKGWTDVTGDGNCGFRVIAEACYGDQDCWPHVRRAMSLEIQANIEQYATLYGGIKGPSEAISRISGLMYGQAPPHYWIDTPLDLYSASTLYNVAFVMISTVRGDYRDTTESCTTVLPLRPWSGARGPNKIVGIAHVNTNHYVLVYLRDNCPLPPVWYRWEKARHESVAGWKDFYSSRMVEWTNLRGNVNRHNFSDQVATQCDPIDVSTPNATTESIKELNVTSQSPVNVHESALEHVVGSGLHPFLGDVRECSNSIVFDIKATYKEDTVKFKWSSTACLKELRDAVIENLNLNFDKFKLKYRDEEEWLLINTNEHLKSAISYIKNNILRLQVTDL